MFCPKCGVENPDNGKFCRGCGANLTHVLAVVDGEILIKDDLTVEDDFAKLYEAKIKKGIEKSMESENNYADLYSTGIRNVILGLGFFLVGLFLKVMPPHDTFLWVLMMIPGFCLLASGVRRILKSEVMKKEISSRAEAIQQPTLSQNRSVKSLPPTQAEYISPLESFTTNDLVAPSVTEETTKHLKMKKNKANL
jgi:hypothetical protein